MKASTKKLLDRSHTWFQKVNIETWAIGWVYPVVELKIANGGLNDWWAQ
jgi:hypothetical protein